MFKIRTGSKRKKKKGGGVMRLGALHIGPRQPRSRRRKKSRWFSDWHRRMLQYRAGAVFVLLFLIGISVYAGLSGGFVGRTVTALDDSVRYNLAQFGLAIHSVTVDGRDMTRRASLDEALGIERGQSILHFDCHELRARLLELDWVADARVSRLLPHTIHIELEEKQPIAIWQHKGVLHLVDAEGDVISSDHVQKFAHLPFVVGEGAGKNADELIRTLTQFPTIRSMVEVAVRVGSRRWNLQMHNGVSVQLPENDVKESLIELADLENRMRILGRDIVTIDMRMPDRLIVRKSPQTDESSGSVGEDT